MGYVDKGHYVEKAIVSGPGTMIVPAGMSLHDCYVINNGDGLPFKQVIVEAGAKVDIVFFLLPGVSSDISLLINLVGEGAEFKISGAYICGSEEKINFQTEIIHRVPNCMSDELFNGIASGESEINFNGKIIVAPDAQQTLAYQLNRNILLNKSAKVNTKPQLEIYADDVKCSHGATIGSLNEDEQFYMRSRGIPAEEAKLLQMQSFLSPVLEHVIDEKERKSIQKSIAKALKGII